MTWKAGDSVSLPFYVETVGGVAQVYANAAAYAAAAGTVTWYNGATALSSQPSFTIAPIASTGWHAITFALPLGCTHILFGRPTGCIVTPDDLPLIAQTYDFDYLGALLGTSIGVPAVASGITSASFESIEGDNFPPREFTVPLDQLRFIPATNGAITAYTDLSDIGGQPWTVTASARRSKNQLPASSPDFDYTAIITDKVNRKIAIGFTNTIPAGAKVQNDDGTADSAGVLASTIYLFDVQLVPPTGSTYANRKVSFAKGQHTILRQQTTTP